MAFPTGTIRLAAAKNIFTDVTFREIKIADKVAGYSATMPGYPDLEHTSLTELCHSLWARSLKVTQEKTQVTQHFDIQM